MCYVREQSQVVELLYLASGCTQHRQVLLITSACTNCVLYTVIAACACIFSFCEGLLHCREQERHVCV